MPTTDLVAAVDPLFVNVNLVEAGLWVVIGVVFVVAGVRTAKHRRAYLALAPIFVVFGLSDIVESRTGAWWRPWWLLAWKGGCVLVFLIALGMYIRARIRKPAESR